MRRRIGDWIADDQTDTLQRGETVRKLERRAMAVLCHLADRPGEVVGKDALIEAVWGPVAISDHSVAIVISQIRRALDDSRSAPAYIQTIPKRGYRLIADVGAADSAPQPIARTEAAPSSAKRRLNPWLAGALAVVAALFVAAPLAMQQKDSRRAIAVADFVNATGSDDMDHVAFALSELVSSRLIESSGAKVVRRRGPEAATGENTVLLTGRLLRDGGANIVSVQLTDPATGEVLRGNAYRLESQTFVAAASEIARDAAAVIGRPAPALVAADQQAPEAYELYWRARYAASVREHDSLRRARDILVTLVRDYPAFAEGHAALADIYAHKTGEHLGLPRLDTFAEAERHLSEARRLGGETSATAVTAALLSFYRDRDLDAAMRHARRASDLSPGNAAAWQTRGMIASASGKDRDALDAIERARALDPAAPSILWDRVWFLYVAERHADALAAAEEASRISAPVDLYVALANDALGRSEEAWRSWLARAAKRGLEVEPLSGRAGTADDYRALLAAMDAAADYAEGGVPLALLRLKAEDRAGAIEAVIETAPPRDNWLMMWARRLKPFEPLRADARVAALADPKQLPAE